MNFVVTRRLLGSTIPALLLLVGCTADPPELSEGSPGAAARNLFVLADETRRPDDLETVFDHAALEDRRVELLEALDSLPAAPAPELTGVVFEEGDDAAFADLDVELRGGGLATYNVKLHATPAGDWRIAWFQGPGVEWPARGRRGDGLTTSDSREPPRGD